MVSARGRPAARHGPDSPLLKRLPVTPAIIYLAVGLLVGPTVLNLFHFNPLKESALLEVLTEVVVLISLFSAGVKMPVPFSFARWRTPILLASVSMAVSVALVAAFAYFLLGLPLGAGVLLGAILAPTDPVLATDVQTRHPGDRDRLRFTLTCEAGMNDGSAFPFVMLGMGLLGLHELGEFGLRWALVDVLWATVAGVAIGILSGAALAHMARKLRGNPPRHKLMDDFLGLGLIGVVYGLSVLAGAWGFLAVFFAAVALRQTELKLASTDLDRADPAHPDEPQDERIEPEAVHAIPDDEPAPTVSEGSLIFKEHLERLSELVLVLLIGGTLFSIPGAGARWTRAVPVCRGAPGERLRRPAGHAHAVADTRHGGLVRGARHRFAVLPDVCHPAWPPRRTGPGSDPVDADCGLAFDSRPRHQRQAADETFFALPQASAKAMSSLPLR